MAATHRFIADIQDLSELEREYVLASLIEQLTGSMATTARMALLKHDLLNGG